MLFWNWAGAGALVQFRPMDRLLLSAATLCFLASAGYTLYALGAGRLGPGRFNLAAIGCGFAFQSGYLIMRGQQVRSCPITTFFDLLVFLSWSIVLIYFVVGTAYRLSLLGAFTAPLVLALQIIALLVSPGGTPPPHVPLNPWVELHAALSVIAYGAFALGAISGVMYLLQEHELKARHGGQLLYSLPAINDLGTANRRLLAMGFALLTVAFAAGIAAHLPVAGIKFATSIAIWACYGILLALGRFYPLSPASFARASIALLAVALITLPGIQYLSTAPRP